ncbi:MAG TPA: low affinity iron permease family protein [Blastocatellia bacterium]|nr:low affinity iron permease family protein [Blastocatellia bacterium]
MGELFRRFSDWVDDLIGSPWTFVLLLLGIIGWAVAGFIHGFSDEWQMIFDNTTSVLFLLLLFLMQNSQNRDSKAIHLKLDELIRAVEGARTSMVKLENLSGEELERLEHEFRELHQLHAEANEGSRASEEADTSASSRT